MSIVIFYLDKDGVAHAPRYQDHEWNVAQQIMAVLRKQGHTHVIMSNEPDNMVGKPGVDSVVDGKTPDGHAYDWSKADRAGRMRKSDEFRPVRNDGEDVR